MNVETDDNSELSTEDRIDQILTDSETLRGDVRDAILDRIKNLKHPWPLMKQVDQQEMINGCDQIATNLVNEVVRKIAVFGFPALSGVLVKANLKDVMQCQIDVSRFDRQREVMLDHIGKPVMIVLADPETFSGESQEAKPDPDQSDMLDSSKARTDKD